VQKHAQKPPTKTCSLRQALSVSEAKLNIYIVIALFLLSSQVSASNFNAKCEEFKGIEFDVEKGSVKPFELNDGTIYEFNYTSKSGGKLLHVVDGVGIIEPKKSERWEPIQLLQQTDKHISAISYIDQDYMLFTLYPKLGMLHIAWISQPNIRYKNGNTLLIKVSCEFTNK